MLWKPLVAGGNCVFPSPVAKWLLTAARYYFIICIIFLPSAHLSFIQVCRGYEPLTCCEIDHEGWAAPPCDCVASKLLWSPVVRLEVANLSANTSQLLPNTKQKICFLLRTFQKVQLLFRRWTISVSSLCCASQFNSCIVGDVCRQGDAFLANYRQLLETTLQRVWEYTFFHSDQ